MGQFAQEAEKVIRDMEACGVGQVVKDFDEDDITLFERLMKDRKVTAVRSILGDKAPSEKVFRIHAKGECRCPDGTLAKGVTRG